MSNRSQKESQKLSFCFMNRSASTIGPVEAESKPVEATASTDRNEHEMA